MKISVSRASAQTVKIRFDTTEVELDGAGVKTLLAELTRLLAPGPTVAVRPAVRIEEFLARLKSADDVGLQALLQRADDNDVLMLLKVSETDARLSGRLFGNMSERSAKIFREDLAFRFKDEVPREVIGKGVERIFKIAKQLEKDGKIRFKNNSLKN